jgi:hypothetical protein
MHRGLISILIALGILLAVPLFGQERSISIHIIDTSFSEFCQTLSQKSGTQIYFQERYFQNKKVSLDMEHVLALDALRKVVDLDSFMVVEWQDALVVIKGKSFPLSLADYQFTEQHKSSEIDDGTDNETGKYISTTKANAIERIVVGKKNYALSSSTVYVRGIIKDAETDGVLPGATAYIVELKKGASANSKGHVSFYIRPGKYTLRVLFMGMKTKNYQFIVYSNGHFEAKLEKEGVELSGVNVYGDRQMNMRQKEPGLEKMTTKDIKEIPVMAGEPDIVKASTMLPGIVSVGEGNSGLSVRGGSSDQNAFYLNDIPIFNTSHLFGFFPAFNADLVKDFTIYKGYIPSSFGGRLSSVFDIQTRKGNRRKFSLHGGISPMAANMVLSTPIIEDQLSVIASARTSYSDWILRKIKDPNISKSSAKFSDFSLGLYYDLAKTQVSVFAYHSNDYFAYSYINEYEYSNDGISAKVKHKFSSRFRGIYTAELSEYKFETWDYQEQSTAYNHPYSLMQNEFRADHNYIFNNNNQLNFGYHLTYYGLNRGVVNPVESSLRTPVDLGKEKGMENALYVSDRWSAFDWLEFNFGFRYSVYTPLGPKNVYQYQDGQYIDEQYISDTLVFGNNEVIEWYHFPEFRFAAKIDVDKHSSFKLAVTQMHQNLFMLNTTFSISPSSQWKLADYHIKPSQGNQFSAGYFRSFVKYGFETSVEGFYKTTKNYTEFKDGADFLKSDKVELSVLQGDQWSYGVELLLRRRGDFRFTGWIAYTYSRSWVQVSGEESWQNINQGEKYPAAFDIPHSVSALLNIKLSKRLSFSTTVNYQSGRPMTYPISIYYVNNIPFVDYSARNEYRIPDYFRVDASLTLDGNLKRKKFIHSQFVLSVYNITGRDNPYSVYFTVGNNGISGYQYSVIAVPVFTASWIFKLGNYDAD